MRGLLQSAEKARLMELRPLGFGEIFDRAVTLYIRNLVPFVAIVSVLVLPLAVLQYVIDIASQPQYDEMLRAISNPHAARPEHVPTIFDSPVSLLALGIVVLLSYTIAPFVLNAVAVGVARLYRGRPVEFRACYAVSFARWPQTLGVIGIDFLVFVGFEIALALVVGILVVIGIALFSVLPAIAPLEIVVGALLILAMLPFTAPLFIALAFAMNGVVIEQRGVVESLLLGLQRVFNRSEFWRAMLVGIAALAIIFGGSTMFSMLAIVAGLFHLPVLQAIIQSLPSAIINPLAAVIFVVYYFDVRIRREGFDLEAGIERLTATQTA